MRKFRLLLLAMASLMCTAVSAQTDETLVFMDSNGNVLEDGSEIRVNASELLDDGMGGNYVIIPSGLSVKNTSSETCGVGLDVNIEKIDNGQLQFCFPSNCNTASSAGNYNGSSNSMNAGQVKDFATEWIPTAYGECTALFKLKIMDVEYNDWNLPTYSFKAYGPSVKVTFVYDETSTGINGTLGDKKPEVSGYYTIEGFKTDKLHKGLNIVKYKDGSSDKVFIK